MTKNRLFLSLLLLISLSFFDNAHAQETQDISEDLKLEELPSLEIIQQHHLSNADFLTRALGVDTEKENLTRRGEIIFFVSFSYLWTYQFLLFDMILSTLFNDDDVSGQLSAGNFIFSIASTVMLALMVTRKDTLFMRVEAYGEKPFGFFKQKPKYKESVKSIGVMLDLFHQEF